jgi:hypothetical protein
VPRSTQSSKRPSSPRRASGAGRKTAGKSAAKGAAKKGAAKGGARKTAAKAARAGSFATPSAGISRIDQPDRRTHGYFVRVGYKKTDAGWRPTATAFFGDISHGGRRSAWQAAEEWLAKTRRQVARQK